MRLFVNRDIIKRVLSHRCHLLRAWILVLVGASYIVIDGENNVGAGGVFVNKLSLKIIISRACIGC